MTSSTDAVGSEGPKQTWQSNDDDVIQFFQDFIKGAISCLATNAFTNVFIIFSQAMVDFS